MGFGVGLRVLFLTRSLPAPSFQIATMSTVPVLISAGAVLGRVNLVQLSVMVLIEAVTFSAMRAVSRKFLHVSPGALGAGGKGGHRWEGRTPVGGKGGRRPAWMKRHQF